MPLRSTAAPTKPLNIGCGRGGRRVERLARDVDHGALEAEAEAEIGDAVVTRVTRGRDLALDSAMAESAWHDDPGDALQLRAVPLVEGLGLDPADLDTDVVVD